MTAEQTLEKPETLNKELKNILAAAMSHVANATDAMARLNPGLAPDAAAIQTLRSKSIRQEEDNMMKAMGACIENPREFPPQSFVEGSLKRIQLAAQTLDYMCNTCLGRPNNGACRAETGAACSCTPADPDDS